MTAERPAVPPEPHRPPLAITPAPADFVDPALLGRLGLDQACLEGLELHLLSAGSELAGIAGIQAGSQASLSVLAVAPEWRGKGYGAEAVGRLLDRLRRSGAGSVRVLAPEGNGLAVYFWFRMGFRPDRATGEGLLLFQDLTR